MPRLLLLMMLVSTCIVATILLQSAPLAIVVVAAVTVLAYGVRRRDTDVLSAIALLWVVIAVVVWQRVPR